MDWLRSKDNFQQSKIDEKVKWMSHLNNPNELIWMDMPQVYLNQYFPSMVAKLFCRNSATGAETVCSSTLYGTSI